MCSASQPCVAAHRARRCAARSTSCRAARCRRSPSRSSRSRASRDSGRCTWSGCTARPRPSGPAASGAPTVCMHGTKSPSPPSTSNTARAHARHDLHVDGDVGAVGQLDADVRDRRAERAHRERHHVHRAAAHAAAEQRRRAVGRPVCSSARISAGAIQLLVGPASSSRSRADEGAVLDARHVARAAAARGSCWGAASGLSFLKVPAATSCAHEPVVLGGAAVAPVDVARLGQRGHLGDPGDQLGVAHVGGRAAGPAGRGRRFIGDAIMEGSKGMTKFACRTACSDGANAGPEQWRTQMPRVIDRRRRRAEGASRDS